MTTKRAKDLIALSKYDNGGCGQAGATRPDVEPMTDDERRMIVGIWNARSGSSRQIDVLYDIANGRILVNMVADAIKHELAKPNNGL